MIVAFLALVAIASVIYSGDANQDANAEQNALYEKTRSALAALWTASEGLAGINFIKSTNISSISPEATTIANPSFWSDLWSKIKEEWQSGGETKVDFSLPAEEDVIQKLKSLPAF